MTAFREKGHFRPAIDKGACAIVSGRLRRGTARSTGAPPLRSRASVVPGEPAQTARAPLWLMLWLCGDGTLRAAERTSVSRGPEPEGGAVPALRLSGAAARNCSLLSPAGRKVLGAA